MDIIYFGSSGFSVPFLEKLDDSPHSVKCVFTYTDKKRGRGRSLSANPVKECAVSRGIEVYELDKFDKEVLDKIAGMSFDYAVVISFGIILPEEVFKRWPDRWLNVHPSLLPEYRGPAPMSGALLDGARRSGVTINRVVHKVDSGDIFAQTAFDIEETDNLDSLMEKSVAFGAPLLVNVLDLLDSNEYETWEQDEDKATYTKKIAGRDLEIDWHQPAEEIFNRIRAFSSKPGAYTVYNSKRLKILSSNLEGDTGNGEPGTVISADRKSGILVACGDGSTLRLELLQPQGKKPMDAISFMNGYRIKAGTVLGKE